MLADGKTNFEIAEALGLSLEGAKYHVSEILAKLGVESREEAVASWRGREHGVRWPRVRIWAPVAACLIVAVGLAVLIPLLSDEDDPRTDEPGTWVAWADDQLDSADETLQLHILSGSPLQVERVFNDRSYRSPHWSPDGQHLAVYGFANPDPRAKLVVFGRKTWKYREVAVDALGAIAWSPDGKHLAHFGRGEIAIYDRDLRIREVVTGLPSQNRPIGGLAVWAPDSKKFVAAFQGELIVVTVSGDFRVVELPHEDFVTGGAFVGGFGRAFVYWEDDDAFIAISPPLGRDVSVGEYRRWTFRRDGNRWKSVSSQGGPGFPDSTVPGESEPDGGFYQGRSADGGTAVFATMRFSDVARITKVWTSEAPPTQFEVDDAGDAIGGLGQWFDIVVVRE